MSKLPTQPTSTTGRWWDAVVVWVVNLVLRCGSPWLQAMIGGSIRYGLVAAAKDEMGETDDRAH